MNAMQNSTRVIQWARMLPMSKLTDEHIVSVRKTYLQYTYKFNITAAAAAKATGIAASTLSQWANDKYRGDSEGIARKVNSWIADDARRRDVRVDLPYVPTKVAEDMRTMAKLAYDERCMAALVCPSGAGKTMVLQLLAQEMNGFYIYCHEQMTPKKFVQTLAKAVKALPAGNTIADLIDAVVEKVMDSGRPIMLDEGQRLPPMVYTIVRTIHDRSQSPVIIAGTEEILTKINDRANNAGQFHSRTLRWNAMDYVENVANPDGQKLGRPLFSREEVQALFAHMPLKLRPEAEEMVWAITCLPGYGCVRTVKRVLNMAYRKWPNKAITRNELWAIVSIFYGSQGVHIRTLAEKHAKVFAEAG